MTSGCPGCAGISVQLALESLSSFGWNQCPACAGIRSRTRMEAACERALAVGAHHYRSVASILDKGLDRQPLVAQQAELALPDHANVRGPGYYH